MMLNPFNLTFGAVAHTKKRRHGRVEVLFTEVALLVDNKMEPVPSSRIDVMLEGGGSEVSVHHVARLVVQVRYPLGKLQ